MKTSILKVNRVLDHVTTKQRSKADAVDVENLDVERAQKAENRKQEDLIQRLHHMEEDEELKEKVARESEEARRDDSDE